MNRDRQDLLMGALLIPITLYNVAAADAVFRTITAGLCLTWLGLTAWGWCYLARTHRLRAEFILEYGYDPTPGFQSAEPERVCRGCGHVDHQHVSAEGFACSRCSCPNWNHVAERAS